MPQTLRGIPCPSCRGMGVTEYVAIVPRVKGEQVIEAGSWACCVNCYKEQWAEVYGAQFGGMTYDEYIESQKVTA